MSATPLCPRCGIALAAAKEGSGFACDPYVDAVWKNFAEGRKTWTEELATGRSIKAGLERLRGWLRHEGRSGPPDRSEDGSPG